MIGLIALAAILTPLSTADQVPLQGAGCTVVSGKRVILITDYATAVVRLDGKKQLLRANHGVFDLRRNNAFTGEIKLTIRATGSSVDDEDNETQDTPVVVSYGGQTLAGKLSCYA